MYIQTHSYFALRQVSERAFMPEKTHIHVSNTWEQAVLTDNIVST